MFRRSLKTIAIMLAISTLSVQAITKEEMEKARVEAAVNYVRFTNNSSGYLDGRSFSSMAELESAVASHNTDKENLAKFKSATNTGEYPSWDKEKTVKYFTKDVFNSLKKPENGADMMVGRIQSKLNGMNFSAPSTSAPASAPAPDSQALSTDNTEQTEAPTPVTLSDGEATVVEDVTTTAEVVTADSGNVQEEVNTQAGPRTVPAKKGSSTWLLVLMLILIVAVAAWLIYYASKVMKGGGRSSRRDDDDDDDFVDSRKVNMLERENDKLRQENRALKGECKALQSELSRVRGEMERIESERQRSVRRNDDDYESTELEAPVRRRAATQPRMERVIWLGRVNADGIFVRADKEYNPDATLYRLVTTDGYSGSFTFVDEPESVEMAVGNPRRMLAGGCMCANMEDTEGVSHINTLSAGTAIFESGCWKIIRKAKISYS